MKQVNHSLPSGRTSLWDLFLLGFGAIIGVGWSSTLNNLILCGGGILPAAAGFSLAAAAFVPIALCYGELSAAMPASGGVLRFVGQALGPAAAFAGGWFMVMSYTAILPFEAIALSDMVGYLFPMLRSGAPIYTIAGEGIYPHMLLGGVAAGAVILLINLRGTAAGFAFQRLSALTLLTGSGICLLFCLLKADPQNLFSPVYAPVAGKNHFTPLLGVVSMLAIAPQYFSGFDTIAQSADPGGARSIGKVIAGALLSAGLFYLAVFLCAGLASPWQEMVELGRPVLSNLLRRLYPGPGGALLWGICMAATFGGLFGAWNGFFIASTRLMAGMADQGLLPGIFGRTGAGGVSPAACCLCGAAMLAGPFLGAGVLDVICTLSSAGFVIAWGLSCLAVRPMRDVNPALPRPYRIPGGNRVPRLAVLLCLLMLVNCLCPGMPGFMGAGGLTALLFWSALGVLFYFRTARWRGRACP